MPAPPPESEPAMVSAFGTAIEIGVYAAPRRPTNHARMAAESHASAVHPRGAHRRVRRCRSGTRDPGATVLPAPAARLSVPSDPGLLDAMGSLRHSRHRPA